MKHCCKYCKIDIPFRNFNKKFCSPECRRKYIDEGLQEKLDSGIRIRPHTLRMFLLRKFGHCCSKCKLTHWRNELIPLNLDHIDGNSENNLESNLRFLCLNCDGLEPTYGARNRGNGRWSRRQRYSEGKSS